jgi:hypothetical protein
MHRRRALRAINAVQNGLPDCSYAPERDDKRSLLSKIGLGSVGISAVTSKQEKKP